MNTVTMNHPTNVSGRDRRSVAVQTDKQALNQHDIGAVA
jgi:hypothetical protein